MPLNLPRLKSGKLAPPPLIIRKPRRPGWALLTGRGAACCSVGAFAGRLEGAPGRAATHQLSAHLALAAAQHVHKGQRLRPGAVLGQQVVGACKRPRGMGKHGLGVARGLLRHGCAGPKAAGVHKPRQAGEPSMT